MFGIGMPELILILAIALMVIGPKKLPDLAKSLGRAMREFKKATSELKDSMELDGEVKEVKDTFDDVRSDIKRSMFEDKPAAGAKAIVDQPESGSDRAAEDLMEERPTDPGVEGGSGEDAAPQPPDKPQAEKAESGLPDGPSAKDS